MSVSTVYGDYGPAPQQGANNNLIPQANLRSFTSILTQDHATLVNGAADIGSTIQMGDVAWTAILLPHLCTLQTDAAGAGVTATVGDSNSANGLLAATSIAAAGTVNPAGSVTRANMGKQLWQLLGYASLAAAQATRATCRLFLTIGGANVSATTNVWWCLVGAGSV